MKAKASVSECGLLAHGVLLSCIGRFGVLLCLGGFFIFSRCVSFLSLWHMV